MVMTGAAVIKRMNTKLALSKQVNYVNYNFNWDMNSKGHIVILSNSRSIKGGGNYG